MLTIFSHVTPSTHFGIITLACLKSVCLGYSLLERYTAYRHGFLLISNTHDMIRITKATFQGVLSMHPSVERSRVQPTITSTSIQEECWRNHATRRSIQNIDFLCRHLRKLTSFPNNKEPNKRIKGSGEDEMNSLQRTNFLKKATVPTVTKSKEFSRDSADVFFLIFFKTFLSSASRGIHVDNQENAEAISDFELKMKMNIYA